MKKRYVSPGIHVQHFMANEYIANCEDEYLVVVRGCNGDPVNLIVESYPTANNWTTGHIEGLTGNSMNIYPTNDGNWLIGGSIYDAHHIGTGLFTGEYAVNPPAPNYQTCTDPVHIAACNEIGSNVSASQLHHHFSVTSTPVKNHS